MQPNGGEFLAPAGDGGPCVRSLKVRPAGSATGHPEHSQKPLRVVEQPVGEVERLFVGNREPHERRNQLGAFRVVRGGVVGS